MTLEEYTKSLTEAKQLVGAGMSHVQNASTQIHDFDKSKPLNLLYKELRASFMLLSYYAGDIENLPKEGYEIATPQSIKAYHNLNT